MKRALIPFLLLASAVFGQAPTPAPAPSEPAIQYFTITGAASGFNQSSGTTVASTAGAAVQLTRRVSLGYNQVSIPAKASYRLGVVNYGTPLSALLGKKLSSHFVFDVSQVQVTFQGGVGKELVTAGAPSHIAESAGASIAYPLATHLSMQLLGYQYIHSNPSGFIQTNSTQNVSSGLIVHF